MASSPNNENRILAAVTDDCTLVAVMGSGNFKLAPAFKQATMAARLAGSALIVVDLGACVSLDSTFMGGMASLGFAIQKDGHSQLVFINLSPSAAALLKGLGLDRLLKTYPAGALPGDLGNLASLAENLRPVATTTGDHDMAALMYDAHETLSRVSPENLSKFKDVLAFLKEDLKRE